MLCQFAGRKWVHSCDFLCANTHIHLLITHRSVSWSTSAAPLWCWTWPLDAAAAGRTSPSCRTSVGRRCRRRASSADETVSPLGGAGACGSRPSAGRTRPRNSLCAQRIGSPCRDPCRAHPRTPGTSRGSWRRAENGEGLQKTTAGKNETKSDNTEGVMNTTEMLCCARWSSPITGVQLCDSLYFWFIVLLPEFTDPVHRRWTLRNDSR